MKKILFLALSISCLNVAPSQGATLPIDAGIDWNLSVSVIQASCTAGIDTAKKRIGLLEKLHPKPTSFEQLAATEDINADLADALVVQQNLAQLAVSKAVRDAASSCSEQVAAFTTRMNADPLIYAYAKFGSDNAPDANGKQLAKVYLEKGRRAGAALSPAKRLRVTRLIDGLNHLQTAFMNELGNEQLAITITQDEAQSLQSDFTKSLRATDAGYIVPVDESTILAFETQEKSSDARRRYLQAYFNRGGAANVKRLKDAIKLRGEIAQLVGFPTWADYQLDSKTAKTPARALELLNRVDKVSLPKARAEIEEMAKLKLTDGEEGPFSEWDSFYYAERLRKTKYSVDENAVKQYFPVDKVIPALLSIFEELLGVRFEPIKAPQVWAPGILEFEIVDTASQKAIGWFYFDLYPRDGKYGHFAAFPLRAGRRMSDGSYQRPVGAIVGNWPVATPGSPSLLTHSDVIIFFHEFGHLMHDTLTKAPTETLAGLNVRGDFVEAPSQMLENWIWEPEILKKVTSNVTTGEPMPDDLIAHLTALRHFGEGQRLSDQAFVGVYDITLHNSREAVDPTALWFDLKPSLSVFPAQKGTIPEASFIHLMAGYDAGYYGYIWSLVYAQDMFTRFKREGLENPETGMRYRTMILERGATEEPDALVREFLDRPVDTSAFDDYVGLARDAR